MDDIESAAAAALSQEQAPEADAVDAINARFAAAFGEEAGEKKPAEETKPAEGETKEAEGEGKEAKEATPAEGEGSEWWKNMDADAAFKKIRHERKEALAKVAEMEAKLSKYEKVDLTEVDSLRTRHAEQEKKIAALNLEESEIYQQQITAPMRKLVAEAKDIGGEDLLAALSEPNRMARNAAVSAFMETKDALTAAAIERIARGLDDLQAKQTEMRENAVDALKELRAEEQRLAGERTEKQRRLYAAEVDRVTEALSAKLPAGFLDSEAGKKAVEGARQTDFAKTQLTTQAYAAVAASVLPGVTVQLKKAQEEISTLKGTIASLQKASPGGGAKPPAGGGATPSGDESVIDSIDKKFRAAGWS